LLEAVVESVVFAAASHAELHVDVSDFLRFERGVESLDWRLRKLLIQGHPKAQSDLPSLLYQKL
jgi:hypothetical protein